MRLSFDFSFHVSQATQPLQWRPFPLSHFPRILDLSFPRFSPTEGGTEKVENVEGRQERRKEWGGTWEREGMAAVPLHCRTACSKCYVQVRGDDDEGGEGAEKR